MMPTVYPRVIVNLKKLQYNVDRVASLCHSRKQTFAAVTKCICADKQIVQMLEQSRCDWIADSQVENLQKIETKKPRFLIRAAQPCQMDEAVRCADISLVSEPSLIAQLGTAAARQGVRHRVVLACDLGDLREGCFFQNEADIFAAAEAVLAQSLLELYGVGMNLGCFGGVLPCRENMEGLVHIAQTLRRRYDIPLPVVSGGTTNMIGHLQDGTVVEGLNNCRIGELWLAGHDPGTGRDVPGFLTDCFTLQAQLIEVKDKPSKPIGPIGGDAFGNVTHWPDQGPMRRGILACGKQNIDLESLRPVDQRIRVLGGSSDHAVLDLTKTPQYRPGSVVEFHLGYGAILRAFTSPYIERGYVW